jgi:ATP-binding protein involved in chromosome partitioning
MESAFGAHSLKMEHIQVQVPKAREKPEVLPLVNNIVAIASGKGGVGKSTVAANLAVALAKSGYRVGLIDADVYGPSIPKMFNVEGERPSARTEDGTEWIIPIEKYGVKLLSVGLFVKPEDALVWRGPMATSALKQLIFQGEWGSLDYLLIDLPPGTGDVHLTMVQELPVTGVVIVSTPQEVAMADVIKGINMFAGEKINVPVLGIVENMSWFTPEELPQNRYYIFGKEGCKKLAEKMGISLLGQIPLVQGIRESGDSGEPVALHIDNPSGKAFHELALSVEKAIEKRNKEMEPTKKVEITTK